MSRFAYQDYEDQIEFLMDNFEKDYPKKYKEFMNECGFVFPNQCIVIPIPKVKSKKQKKEMLRALLEVWIEDNLTPNQRRRDEIDKIVKGGKHQTNTDLLAIRFYRDRSMTEHNREIKKWKAKLK